ncbi:hypothetical protein ACIPXV_03025 [Streptomyces libani]|uniref:hypothetical protein n=1 Tax=Streptomyces TaxID=1883 RepID=UPI0021C926A4|nr:hypothetical protein [Streptomyces sp. Isolate_219]MCR8574730.1 hypothetical protein [Streptomyces sp. Isolate_219]
MTAAPGEWFHISTHPARYSAQATAHRIRTAYRTPAYEPAGAFEARTEPTEFETAVYARYIGGTAQTGSTA